MWYISHSQLNHELNSLEILLCSFIHNDFSENRELVAICYAILPVSCGLLACVSVLHLHRKIMSEFILHNAPHNSQSSTVDSKLENKTFWTYPKAVKRRILIHVSHYAITPSTNIQRIRCFDSNFGVRHRQFSNIFCFCCANITMTAQVVIKCSLFIIAIRLLKTNFQVLKHFTLKFKLERNSTSWRILFWIDSIAC